MRRTILILLAIVVLGAAGYYFLQQRQAAQEPTVEILREQTVEQGKITATVSATGSIEPEALVTLTFGLAGTVQQVNAVRGQVVQPGDVLATLDSDELALAVQQAEDALEVQRLTLEQRRTLAPSAAQLAAAQADIAAAEANLLVAGGSLAAAEAAVSQAQAQRAQLLAGATSAEIAAAEADLATARLDQKQWQDRYDRIIQGEILGWVEEEARQALNAADLRVVAGEARLDVLRAGPRSADIQAANAAISAAEAQVQSAEGSVAVAEANLERARASLALLQEPATEAELAILEAQVAGAETNLALAQLRFNQSRIVAPIAGTVATVAVDAGEQVTPGVPVVTIVNESGFHISVNVDEIDIDSIELNQPVDITLDALPGVVVPGTLAEIAPTPTSAGGVVTYLVTINITETDGLNLRPGMSANASVVVDEVENALVVPNWAIRLDRESGQAFVNVKQPDGTVREVPIETGLRNEQFSAVTSGLSAGDVVAVTNVRESFSLFGGG